MCRYMSPEWAMIILGLLGSSIALSPERLAWVFGEFVDVGVDVRG
jgi:hypothetical protein